MTKFTNYILAIAAGGLLQACSRSLYSSATNEAKKELTFTRQDTLQIIHELLLQVVLAGDVPDYHLIADKKNIYVLNTLFRPHNSEQDTTDYFHFQKLENFPAKIKGTNFLLISQPELRELANVNAEIVTAVQIGYITIHDDVAITGVQTVPFKSYHDKRRVLLAGGGYHCKFQKIKGKWIYKGTCFSNWIS